MSMQEWERKRIQEQRLQQERRTETFNMKLTVEQKRMMAKLSKLSRRNMTQMVLWLVEKELLAQPKTP